jgi:hypothetical protein
VIKRLVEGIDKMFLIMKALSRDSSEKSLLAPKLE